MEETLNTQRIYPKEYQFWKETNILDLHDYRPVVNSFGQVLFTLGDDIYGGTSYGGDTFALYYNYGEWGSLEFGWGSCSVCDALQGCSTWEEVEEIYTSLQNKILRFYKTKDILNYFMNHDWHGEWLSSTKELFINCVIKILIEFEKRKKEKLDFFLQSIL